MDNNGVTKPQEKTKDNHQKVIISLMVMAILLIVELYVMTNMAWNLIALIIVTILFLGSAYFFGNAVLKEIQENKLRAQEQYDAIEKANKASYIMLKKAFEQLEEMDSNSKKPTEEIITAQKAIAKLTISRNKENTDAMMNSNDKVLEKIFDFEENLGNNQSEMLDKQKLMIDDSVKELMLKQQEMVSNMKAMEDSIKNELLQAVSSIQVVQQTQVEPTPQVQQAPMNDFSFDEPTETEDFGIVNDLNIGEDLGIADDLSVGEDLGITDDLNVGEDLDMSESFDLGLGEDLGISDDLGMSDDFDLDVSSDLGLGEESSFGDDLGVSEELSLDDFGISEDMNFTEGMSLAEDMSLGDDLSINSDLDLGIDLMEEEPMVEEPIIEEPIIEEPVMEEASAPEIDLSNPNKMMTPEEIAALIQKM